MEKYAFMALIQCIESAGSPEKSVGRATLHSGVDDIIRVGGLGGAEVEGTGLLGVDYLPIPKGWVGTVGVKDMGQGLRSRGWFSLSLESGRAEKALQVLWWEMSGKDMSYSWIGGTDGHS